MYIDPQIETIEQRPGQSPPIPLEGTIGASTRRGHHAFTARTGVHRSNKKEPSRKLNSRLGARKADHAFFEWLTKGIKHHCAELAHFVEKQHATVRKRDLAGANSMRATADHSHRTHPVMRRAQRWSAHEPANERLPRRRMNSCGIECSGVIKFGQQPWQTIGQHRLA
jgi:hypothetical protein